MKPRNRGNSDRQFHVLYVLALVFSLSSNIVFLSKESGIDIPLPLNHIDNFKVGHSVRSHGRALEADEGFSACMLVMDDNHRLTEWLAYHFHVLPLRHLVAAVDPYSKTSPSAIFDQWRGYGMEITEWNETDVFRGGLYTQYHHQQLIANHTRTVYAHRCRQNMFVRNCLRYMKAKHRAWVILIDSDEYLLFNGPENATSHVKDVRFPSIKEEASVLRFLKATRNVSGVNLDSPCISIPRMLFGAVGSTDDEVQKAVPPGFDPVMFDTLVYRKHVARSLTHVSPMNGWGKAIIDVSRVRWSDIPTAKDAFLSGTVMNIHTPMRICPRPFVKDNETFFRINHYVGSWEAYSYRQDSRSNFGRNQSTWMKKAKRDDETDDNIRPWLSGFVEEHGKVKATEMLQRTGVFEEKND